MHAICHPPKHPQSLAVLSGLYSAPRVTFGALSGYCGVVFLVSGLSSRFHLTSWENPLVSIGRFLSQIVFSFFSVCHWELRIIFACWTKTSKVEDELLKLCVQFWSTRMILSHFREIFASTANVSVTFLRHAVKRQGVNHFFFQNSKITPSQTCSCTQLDERRRAWKKFDIF